MTLVQMQTRPADPAPTTVFDALDASAPQVCDDMTIEVAMSVMASARVGHLLLCDEDDQCTGLVTLAQLAVVRDTPSYTDRIRLRDVVGAGGPFASPVTMVGCALGDLAFTR